MNDIEDIIKNISEMEVNVKSRNGDTVKVYFGQATNARPLRRMRLNSLKGLPMLSG